MSSVSIVGECCLFVCIQRSVEYIHIAKSTLKAMGGNSVLRNARSRAAKWSDKTTVSVTERKYACLSRAWKQKCFLYGLSVV